MSKRKRILLVVAAAVVLLAGVLWVVGRVGSPQTLVLEVSGEPGRKVVGTVEVDGVSQPLAGTLPARFEYRGSRIEFAIAPVGGKPGEQVTVKTSVDGRPSYMCVASGVKGSINRQGVSWWGQRHEVIGGMAPDEVAQLNK